MNIDAEALSEVDVIIAMMPSEEAIKIPTAFKNFVKTRKSQNYIPSIKNDIPLYQQELKKDTRIICSLIYRSYLCSREEKEKLKEQDRKILIQKEQELREKYIPDNIFKNKQESTVIENTNLLVEIKKETFFKKLISFIKGLFNKTN